MIDKNYNISYILYTTGLLRELKYKHCYSDITATMEEIMYSDCLSFPENGYMYSCIKLTQSMEIIKESKICTINIMK